MNKQDEKVIGLLNGMTKEQCKECIIKMVKELEDCESLRCAFLFIHSAFVRNK